ncbi:MAG: DUF3459 domain-containing protein [Sphingomonadales bacterium]|nr:DUF3459 domain-containing protein [Sphingomonadales bacterium]
MRKPEAPSPAGTTPAPARSPTLGASGDEWWRGAAIYQIYPRSFADSNGDGVGDLPGITAHLDHVASLGVDAIWLSPFFVSPMADFGYDVADYCDVDPLFGTLADFDALVARAHGLGLKVTIDLVFAHSSDRHAWFIESRASRHNPRADWYVWADARADGSPPSNWQSVFGGPAWTWDARRRQYYMHQFLKEQPQLNVHNPAVQDALLDVLRFWLKRGVDGFRLDALNHALFDPRLRDNPPARDHGPRTRPFDFQERRFSQDHPGVIAFVERIREVCDAEAAERGTAIFTVAEIGGARPLPLMKAYTAGDSRLSSAYSFAFLYAEDLTPRRVRSALAPWRGRPGRDGLGEGWPSWAFDNHDAPRSLSRWCPADMGAGERQHFARLEVMLLAALRGNIFVYQGQELGLEQDEIPFAQLRDPEAIANWPLTLGRDGVRTPIPWRDEPGGGFTTGVPWLPLSPANRARAVAVQDADPQSLLAWTRRVLAVRRAHAALRTRALEDCRTSGALLVFRRGTGKGSLLCAFNLGRKPLRLDVEGTTLLAANGATPAVLPPWGAIYIAG